jgi:hypothetical protein
MGGIPYDELRLKIIVFIHALIAVFYIKQTWINLIMFLLGDIIPTSCIAT